MAILNPPPPVIARRRRRRGNPYLRPLSLRGAKRRGNPYLRPLSLRGPDGPAAAIRPPPGGHRGPPLHRPPSPVFVIARAAQQPVAIRNPPVLVSVFLRIPTSAGCAHLPGMTEHPPAPSLRGTGAHTGDAAIRAPAKLPLAKRRPLCYHTPWKQLNRLSSGRGASPHRRYSPRAAKRRRNRCDSGTDSDSLDERRRVRHFRDASF